MVMFVIFLYWGLYGWVMYILVALTFGVVYYRLGRSLTFCSVFYFIVGDYVNGLFGDLIDLMFIVCMMFGLCMLFGLGVSSINIILYRMSVSIFDDDDNMKLVIIWGIIVFIMGVFVSGFYCGVIIFVIVVFLILFVLIMILFMFDNTWYFVNSFT